MRSLSSTERYLQLTYALDNIDFDVLGLSEMKRDGCNIEEYEKYILCYVGKTKGLHGVGFLIKKEHKHKIRSFMGISERVALLQLKIEQLRISIIQAYAPTEASEKDEIQIFYNDIEKAHNLADERLIVMGDFNAKVGQPKKEENLCMGSYGYGERNKRGQQLIDYALEHKLSIMNTFFKKKEKKRWTWLSPNQKIKNEIDFIMTNKPRMITNIEVLNQVNFSSDHRLLRATLTLTQQRKSRKNFKTIRKSIKTVNEIEKYINCLKVNLEDINSSLLEDVQTYYDILEEKILRSLDSNRDTQKKQHIILSEQTKKLISKRSELIWTKNKNIQQKKQLAQLFKTTNRLIKLDYTKHREEIISRNLNTYRSAKRAYKEMTLQKKWIQKLKNSSKETKTRKDVIDHATHFYRELYRKEENDEIDSRQDKKGSVVKLIEEYEIYAHIKALKNEKSPGPDGLANEYLKLGVPILLKHLTILFNRILDAETVPKQWCTSDIILIYKKGNPLDIENYRPISLLASAYKLFTSIILRRISENIDASQPVEQAGFRSGYNTIDHIQTAEQLIEKFNEYNKPLYIAFVDYSKAFDSISHASIWNALKISNVEDKYINIIKYIYSNSTSRVKLERRGDVIKIERGVRQGDPLSPKLFISVLENVFRQLKWTKFGINIDGRRLNHLRFADDIIIFAETAKHLQDMLSTLNQESENVGLQMNRIKTKVMTNSFKTPINLKGNTIEYVKSYIYLGKQISFRKNNNEEETERRINITWKKFWSYKEILKGKYNMKIKRTVMDTCLLPCLLYGCQTWTYTNKIKQRITTTQRAMERSILKINKRHKIKNETIRHKTKILDALTHALKLKWQWAGHISRYIDSRWTLLTTRWKGPIGGKRNVGRPIKRWTDDLIKIAGKDWMYKSKIRNLWQKLEEAFTRNEIHSSRNRNS